MIGQRKAVSQGFLIKSLRAESQLSKSKFCLVFCLWDLKGFGFGGFKPAIFEVFGLSKLCQGKFQALEMWKWNLKMQNLTKKVRKSQNPEPVRSPRIWGLCGAPSRIGDEKKKMRWWWQDAKKKIAMMMMMMMMMMMVKKKKKIMMERRRWRW